VAKEEDEDVKIARIIDTNGSEVLTALQSDGRMLRIEGNVLVDTLKVTDEVVEVQRWLPPVEPRVIICIGLNYRKHAEEGGFALPKEPVVFIKNISAAIGHNEPIRIPRVCNDEVDYECELAVVISKTCCNVSKEKALDYVLGYTAANDVSARIWQAERGGTQWSRGKSFDTFAPLGPVLVTTDEIVEPNSLSIKTELNGQVVQNSNTRDMIFDVPALISFLSEDTTLLLGTVILTGTPEGIGWAREPRLLLHSGDTITVDIEKIGRLTNKIE
jgi:2-keto-4-pentenoate hydratase/2-oxohepta-3-ene-1,7-dioic acid hydratase in catechol pathway